MNDEDLDKLLPTTDKSIVVRLRKGYIPPNGPV
jgi:hypothetical protein